jgi:hypothetical protein
VGRLRIVIPGTDALPSGPQRALTEALHTLYRDAGLPSTRNISAAARKNSKLADTISPDTVSRLLRGAPAGSWLKVESLASTLLEMSGASDPGAGLHRIKDLYLEANDVISMPGQEAGAVPDLGKGRQASRASYSVDQASDSTPKVARPPSPGSTTYTLRLPTDYYQALQGMSLITGKSIPELIRDAIGKSLRAFASSPDYKSFKEDTRERDWAVRELHPF